MRPPKGKRYTPEEWIELPPHEMITPLIAILVHLDERCAENMLLTGSWYQEQIAGLVYRLEDLQQKILAEKSE